MPHKLTSKLQSLTRFTLCLLVPLISALSHAQNAAESTLPRYIRYTGVARDLDNKPLTGIVGITFALYAQQTGGGPLWLETQNVQLDANGHYSVLLGSTQPEGLPAEIFATEQARWVGVELERQAEQPRTLLVSAPYALKAGDAETLGGLPPSAFVQVSPAPTKNGGQSPAVGAAASSSGPATPGVQGSPATTKTVTTTGGTANRIPIFTTATNIQNSVIAQKGSNVGIGTTAPSHNLDVSGSNTTATGIMSVTTNTSTSTNSLAVVSAASSKGVTAELVADGLGTGPLHRAGGYLGTSTNQPIGFITDNLPRIEIANDGLIGIPTIPPFDGWQVYVQAQKIAAGTVDAMEVVGYSGASGSGIWGSGGLDAFGGNGDPSTSGTEGGIGVYSQGGRGASIDGEGGYFIGGGGSSGGDGIFAVPGSGDAGGFDGNVNVVGTLTASSKNFKIDHPLDPANKYLVHASVESWEMMNIYTGNVTTDPRGEATVQLPKWFEVLNADFRYQLTVIGQFAQAIVASKIQNHQFTIRTNSPNVEVSWQVTGVRRDAYAKAHPLVVEAEKEVRLKGFYIHPELYGAPAERQIEWARHPQTMKKVQQRRQGVRLTASAK
jgi:hypothetical protein